MEHNTIKFFFAEFLVVAYVTSEFRTVDFTPSVNMVTELKADMKRIYTRVVNFGEIRTAQLAKSTPPHLHAGAPGTFSDILVCSDAKERVGCGKQREDTALIHTL